MADNQIQWAITFITDGVESAMDRVRELSDETSQSVAAGWSSASSTAIEGLTNLQSRSEQAGSRTKEQMEKASNAASLLGSVLGITLPDALQKVLAGSELAGPALEVALEPLAAIAFAQAIVQVVFKVQDLINSWKNLSEEEKRAIDEGAVDARKALDFGHQIIAIRREAALVGNSEVEQARLRAQFAADDAREDKGYLQLERERYKELKRIVDLEGATRKGDAEHNDPYFTNPKTGIRSYPDVPLVSDDQLKNAKAQIRALEDLYGKGLQDLERAAFISAEKRALAEKQAQQAILDTQRQQTQVIELQTQQNKIHLVHEGNQEEVSDYQQAFAAINAATQQFNTRQLAILMTGIKQNSAQVIQASQKYFKTLEDDEAKSLARRKKMFDQFFKGISGAFNSFISGIMKGNETFSQAWAKLVDDMAAKFLEGLDKQLMSFLEHKLMEISIHAEAEQTKDEVSAASHAKEGARSAVTTAQHAYEWASEWGGPVAGAAAAAIAFAGVTAFGSAEGGQYLVPSEQLTMLHRNEMVLPAGVADRMRGVIEGGGARNSALQVHFNMATVDGESGAAFIRRHSRNIAAAVAREMQKKGILSR